MVISLFNDIFDSLLIVSVSNKIIQKKNINVELKKIIEKINEISYK